MYSSRNAKPFYLIFEFSESCRLNYLVTIYKPSSLPTVIGACYLLLVQSVVFDENGLSIAKPYTTKMPRTLW
jgi:hypothetical protein